MDNKYERQFNLSSNHRNANKAMTYQSSFITTTFTKIIVSVEKNAKYESLRHIFDIAKQVLKIFIC